MLPHQDIICILISAVSAENLQKVIELISSYGQCYFQAWSEGYVLLHIALKNKHTEVAKLLLTNTSKVNSKNKKSTDTLLHFAVTDGNIETVKMLLDRGVIINAKNQYGITTLHNAVKSKKIVMCLLKYGSTIDSKDEYGRTALHNAADKGHLEVVKFLLKCGANIDSQDEYCRTALHAAAFKGHIEVVIVLLKNGARIDSEDAYGRTALHYSCKAGHKQIVMALLDHGFDINILSINNHTPLDYAVAGVRSFYNEVYNYDNHDHGINICPFEEIAMILKRHIVKKKAANLYVSSKNLQSISNNDELSDFQNECEEEIASMKSEKFSNANVSFYDILTKDTSQLAMYARNENIVQILRSNYCKIKFPIYASMINSNFRKGEKGKELLEQAHETLHSLAPWLPYLCTKKIFSYLSNEDLRIIIDAKNFI